jgi:hypothetical protein
MGYGCKPSTCFLTPYFLERVCFLVSPLHRDLDITDSNRGKATNGNPQDLDPHYRTAIRCSIDSSLQSATADAWWLQELFNGGNATFGSMERSVDAITTAITNKVRFLEKTGMALRLLLAAALRGPLFAPRSIGLGSFFQESC